MKYIELTKQEKALVDDEDYNWLSYFKWHYANGYAQSNLLKNRLSMHSLIMNTPKGMDTDHINHNTLDNRRENLRICTRSENLLNAKKYYRPLIKKLDIP